MKLYDVPIIPPDLRHEESILKSINSLVYLQNVITEVFDRIDERISVNMSKIANLNHRIDVVNDKSKELVGAKKAIKLMSPAEYPLHEVKDIPMTFSKENCKQIVLDRDYKVVTKEEPTEHKSIDDKLKIYHCRTVVPSTTAKFTEETITSGLGVPPAYIESIDSYLLFNENENIYDDYKKAENMRRNRKTKSTKIISSSGYMDKLEAAPWSIANRKFINKKQYDDLFYSPDAYEVPTLDVPFDLPDLPGIADDFSLFSTSSDARPSIIAGNFFFSDISGGSEVLTPAPTHDEIAKRDEKSVTVVDSPPPVPPSSSTSLIVEKTGGSTSAALPPPPPPPPPPPSSMELVTKTENVKPQSDKTIANIPAPSNDRSTLMAAIRQAGGKSILRSTSANDPDKKELERPPPPPSQSGPGDLMADLHNKLALRRKGISGSKDTGAVNVMDRISAMIPPPPTKRQEQSSGTSEEDDWD